MARTKCIAAARAAEQSEAILDIAMHKRRPKDAQVAGENRYGAWSDMQADLLLVIEQVKLAAANFGDLSGIPAEHVSAAIVTQGAAKELDRLYDTLDAWHVEHTHTRKLAS